MQVKTNVFVNGEHFPEDLEEWLNELKAEGHYLVDVSVIQRPDEPMRVIAYAITDVHPLQPPPEQLVALAMKARDNQQSLDALKIQVADIEAETKHAHEEVGALVSVILEVHRLASTISDDVQNVSLIKAALAKIIEPHKDGGTVVNLTKLLPPRG